MNNFVSRLLVTVVGGGVREDVTEDGCEARLALPLWLAGCRLDRLAHRVVVARPGGVEVLSRPEGGR